MAKLEFARARISNAEIANGALDERYPEAIAVAWSDGASLVCTPCLEDQRDFTRSLPPSEYGYVVSGGTFVCDACGEKVPYPEHATWGWARPWEDDDGGPG